MFKVILHTSFDGQQDCHKLWRSLLLLLSAVVMSNVLQVFASDGRTLLRQLKGHQQAVHVAHFSLDKLHIFSAGDDATVGI